MDDMSLLVLFKVDNQSDGFLDQLEPLRGAVDVQAAVFRGIAHADHRLHGVVVLTTRTELSLHHLRHSCWKVDNITNINYVYY